MQTDRKRGRVVDVVDAFLRQQATQDLENQKLETSQVLSKESIQQTPSNWYAAMSSAMRHMHLPTLSYLIDVASKKNLEDCGPTLFCTIMTNKCDFLVVRIKEKRIGTDTKYNLNTTLRKVAKHGRLDLVEELGELGGDLHNPLVLSAAAKFGHLELVRFLVERGGANVWDGHAFSDAAEFGHLDIVDYLARVSNNTKHQKTVDEIECFVCAFKCACKSGQTHIVRYLMQYKSNIKIETCMAGVVEACAYNNLDIVRLLVETTKMVNFQQETSLVQPLDVAAEYGHADIVLFLLQHDADIHFGDDRALRKACAGGFLHVVELLLAHDDDLHAMNGNALCEACKAGHLVVVEYLLKKNFWHKDALSCAASKGHLSVVLCLVENCMNLHACAGVAFYEAVTYGYLDVVKVFVEKEMFHLHAQHHHDALCLAAQNGHMPIVEYLVEYAVKNFKHFAQVKLNKTLFVSLKNKHLDIAAFLLAHGADFCAQNHKCLIDCLRRQEMDAAKCLLACYTDEQLSEMLAKNSHFLHHFRCLVYCSKYWDIKTKDGTSVQYLVKQEYTI